LRERERERERERGREGEREFDFPKLKRPLRGHRFDSIEEIQAESKKALKAIPEIDFNNCFEDWKKRWRRCLRGITLKATK